jgi:phosphate:Na+ symporter
MAYMAVSHSIFNIVNTIVFLPLIGFLEYIVMKIIPIKKEEMLQMPVVLEEHLLSTPLLALEQVRREILRMAKTSREAINNAVDGLMNGNIKKFEIARRNEKLTDDFQYEITTYLAKLSSKELDKELSLGTPVLLHTINDLERIGDHAVNIVEIAERKVSSRLTFSNGAQIEASNLRSEVNQMFEHLLNAFEHNDPKIAKLTLVNEQNLNKMQRDFRRNHVQRMSEKVCSAESGLIFIDLVDNMEKVGDHLTNIAQSIIWGLQWREDDEELPPPAE